MKGIEPSHMTRHPLSDPKIGHIHVGRPSHLHHTWSDDEAVWLHMG